MPLTFASSDYKATNGNTTYAPPTGFTQLVPAGDLTFAPLTNSPTDSGIGNGLGARQIIGMSALAPCPPRDCRNDPDCFKIPVFGGSKINPGDNDYTSFVLEYPYAGSPPYFSSAVSDWKLYKDVAGTYVLQETILQSSTTCEMVCWADQTGHFIYFAVKIFWDKVLTAYGEGTYYILVTSTIAGELATQCSELFQLESFCCDKAIAETAMPDVDVICSHGVKNGEFDGAEGWSNISLSAGMGWTVNTAASQLQAWFNAQIVATGLIAGETCTDMVDTTNYTVDFDVTLMTGITATIYLGATPGTPITASGTYSQVIQAINNPAYGSVPQLHIFLQNDGSGTNGTGVFGVNSVQFNYIRIDALIPGAGVPSQIVNISNACYEELGQTFNPAGPYYGLPGWTEIGGILHWTNTFPLEPGVLYCGLGTNSAGDFSLLQGSTAPDLVAGNSYSVTFSIKSVAVGGAFTIRLGGTLGTQRITAGTFTETIVCGSDGTGLVIKGECLTDLVSGVGRLYECISIEAIVAQDPTVYVERECHEVADGTLQYEVDFGKVICALPDGSIFDFTKEIYQNIDGTETRIEGGFGFADMIRLPAIFGFQESGEDKIDIRFNSGFVKNIRQEILRQYTLKCDRIPMDILQRIEIYGRFAQALLITDFNEMNPDWKIRQKSVRIDSEWKPDYSQWQKSCSRLIPIEFKLLDREKNIESRICR